MKDECPISLTVYTFGIREKISSHRLLIPQNIPGLNNLFGQAVEIKNIPSHQQSCWNKLLVSNQFSRGNIKD